VSVKRRKLDFTHLGTASAFSIALALGLGILAHVPLAACVIVALVMFAAYVFAAQVNRH
jgi:hypothetical protein